MANYAVEMENIMKVFGDVKANNNISLHIEKGEIRALLGENGAGKSTLMKILYGLYSRDAGRVCINGHEMPEEYSPKDAIGYSVGMVPQHFQMVEVFTVAENIILGNEGKVHKGIRDKEKAYQAIEELSEKYNIHINPRSVVHTLSLGEKQKIEILKAMYRECKVLILDEPTAVLTPQEVDDLFTMMRSLKEKGITIILIAHKLSEVMEVCDTITVLRHGNKVITMEKEHTSVEQLADMMVGRKVNHVSKDIEEITSEEKPVLSLKNISTHKTGERCSLDGLSLDVFRGKIVGVAGIDGNGQTDLVEVLAGIKKVTEGKIEMNHNEVKSMSKERETVAIIPEDRLTQGLVLDFTVKQNLIMRRRHDEKFSRIGFLKNGNIEAYASDLVKKYDIRPTNTELPSALLSGGNQQKIVLSRELEIPELNIVIASQPTRGLDIGAQEFVYSTLLDLRNDDKAVLMISSDLDEIFTLSDYIAVMHDGKIVDVKRADMITRSEIGLYMGGENAEDVMIS